MSKVMSCLFVLLLLAACGSHQNSVTSVTSVTSIASVNYTPIFVNYTSSVVINAAAAGLPSFVGAIEGQWANFGFLSQDEPASAQLGMPYPVFVLNNPGKVSQTIDAMDEWVFPVLVNNNYRCMLTVAKMNGQWKAVGIGSAGFATSLQTTENIHPTLNIKTKGIIKVYGFSSSPYEILAINLSELQPSFLLLPPGTSLVNKLPQYSAWVNTDLVPVLSFEDVYLIFSKM